jgi:hypothetical protein
VTVPDVPVFKLYADGNQRETEVVMGVWKGKRLHGRWDVDSIEASHRIGVCRLDVQIDLWARIGRSKCASFHKIKSRVSST